jgi:hypothetical protein
MLRPTKIVSKTFIIACKQITYLPKKWVMTSVQFKNLKFHIETMHFQFQNAVFFMPNNAECVKESSDTFKSGMSFGKLVTGRSCLSAFVYLLLLPPLMINTT